MQADINTKEDTLQQTQAAASKADAALSQAKAELSLARGKFEQDSAELKQQLESERAKMLVLKERQGGSNKASDVIHALEIQVSTAAVVTALAVIMHLQNSLKLCSDQ